MNTTTKAGPQPRPFINVSSDARMAVRFWHGCPDAKHFNRAKDPGEEEAFDLGLLTPKIGGRGYNLTARAFDLGLVEEGPVVEIDLRDLEGPGCHA